MIRCSICKRFVKNVTYEFNKFTDQIRNVRGECSRCGDVKVEWDCYEDLVGFGEEGK